MSRIFIENLPKNLNENELRKRFSQKGEITDIQLNKGKKTAFIGFKVADQAKEAVEFFHKTFIYSCKITVKLAKGFIQKNESQQLPNETPNEDIQNKASKKKFDPFEELKNDPEFESFLKVQRNIDLGKGKQIWKDDIVDYPLGNEDEEQEDTNNVEEGKEEEDAIVEIVKNSKSKDTFEFTVKVKGLPYKIKKRQLKDFFLPIKPKSLRLVPKVKGIAYVSFENDADLKQALVKHRGFIEGHRIEIVRFQVKSSAGAGADNAVAQKKKSDSEKKGEKWKNAVPASEPIGESGRIYVRNLTYTCSEEELRQLFEKYGPLTEVHMPIDSYTKKPKGFAFVTFVFPEHAVKAYTELDKTDFQGRLLHLLAAHAKNETTYKGPPPPPPPEGGNEETTEGSEVSSNKSSFKQKKTDELKEKAQDAANWNTLFIRPNAVADIMTKKFEVNKLDLLTQSNKKDNVAVRMALGETQIVNEVRQFLLRNKVSLDSFSRGHDCPRSKTVILVKNLPAETTEGEIMQLFSKFGLVNRVILPPYGVTAIIEMQEPNEAKFAFKKLAYTNFKHYPLYLEWAPEDVFDGNASNAELPLVDTLSNLKTTSQEPPKKIAENENEEETDLPEDDATIFVKNLNFQTEESDLSDHFSKIGRVYKATIATKKSANGLLSMGYGFVQFFSSKDAKEAIKRMQSSVLEGHTLELKMSNRTVNKPAETASSTRKPKTKGQKQTGSKICVKNIPFEATEKDIQKIFGVYGQIKTVRLPKKLAGSSSFRGFGFVDFATNEDAKRAFDVLSHSTHLYGRPLVLEWAKESSSAEDLLGNNEVRQVGAKMARYFGNSQSGPSSKRLKKSELLGDLQRSSGNGTASPDENSGEDE